MPGLTVGAETRLVLNGEGSFLDPFPGNGPPTLLIGDAERTLRVALRADLTQPWYFVRANVGVNRTQNDGFVRDRTRTRLVGLVEAGARVRFAAPLGLGF